MQTLQPPSSQLGYLNPIEREDPIEREEPSAREVASDRPFENCDAARAAGAAPVRRGQDGYGAHLDRDGDGIGCEPFPR
ncbi:excalibur calcium-binding domain-containing protein [Vitreimonas flagellata]|uniref:excalibur calcium-binding domain-containing protein n=1 Tax=Vitreimonas flagellata TaxID=2560861 RepID=UPI00107573ED